jgi:virulence-associated protein VagC
MRTAKLFQNGQSQAVRLPIAVGESGESAVRGRFAGFQEFK